MTQISFSITDAAGTASVTIYGGDTVGKSSYLLDGGFPYPSTITTIASQTIAGSAVVNGRQTDGLKVWSGVRAVLTEDDFRNLEACALKSDAQRQADNSLSILFKDQFYQLQEVPPRTRAIATGGTTARADGNILYYASYNVCIPTLEVVKTNILLNGSIGFEVDFDILELDKTTP